MAHRHSTSIGRDLPIRYYAGASTDPRGERETRMDFDTPSGAPDRVLGVDPGLQVTGYAILEATPASPKVCEAGVIRSASGRATPDLAERVLALYNGIVEVLDQ